MSRYQRIWQYFRQHRHTSRIMMHIIVASAFILVLLGSAFGPALVRTFAQASCAQGDQTYIVQAGDTLDTIANSYQTDWQRLSSYNKLSNPNLLFIDQRICIPSQSSAAKAHVQPGSSAIRGRGNPYAYPQCTWWASQRYHQLHNIYVPWTTNANAWQWTARAREFHWEVSSRPSVGAIINLQRWVQGARGMGHVAVVEKILPNGHVLASNMNWYPTPFRVTYVEFAPGPGITFITA